MANVTVLVMHMDGVLCRYRVERRRERLPMGVLLIDDKVENVTGAREAGLQAAQASGSAQVRAAMDDAGGR